MSPLLLRRYRAERLLREEFAALRGQVLAIVSGRLRAAGVELDRGDLEACYAVAWQGLYTAVLAGESIANLGAWLALVTYRRAIDEHRSRSRAPLLGGGDRAAPGAARRGSEADLAGALDDRVRVRRLLEGLRGGLDAREREAAALCYLQGLSRAQAAAQMGISRARMDKLMDGRDRGAPGVAGKVGALVASIREERFCEERSSLMRAHAFGILEPGGERHRLAVMHHESCPACRAYVRSLRGLAAALPPVLAPWSVLGRALAAGTGAGAAGTVGHGLGHGAHSGAAHGAGAGGAAPIPLSASAGAGASAGGGWLAAAGGIAPKLAVGCLVALSAGAGCLALRSSPAPAPRPAHARIAARGAAPPAAAALAAAERAALGAGSSAGTHAVAASGAGPAAARARAAARAAREFGAGSGGIEPADEAGSAASAGSPEAGTGVSAGSTSGGGGSPQAPLVRVSAAPASAAPAAPRAQAASSATAEREFSPG